MYFSGFPSGRQIQHLIKAVRNNIEREEREAVHNQYHYYESIPLMTVCSGAIYGLASH